MRCTIAVLLTTVAVAKIISVADAPRQAGGTANVGLLVVAAFELCLAVLLARERTATLGAVLTAYGFLGGALTTMVFALSQPDGSCRCFGAMGPLKHSWAVAIQGVVIMGAAWSMSVRGRTTDQG